MNAFPLTALVTVAAICLYFYMGFRVGSSRVKYNVIAPATQGHPDWERLHRVHMNTLEAMPMFLPLLWLFASFQSDVLAASIGVVWIIGRAIFMVQYSKAADKRTIGFLVQFVATITLLVGTLVGIVSTLLS